MTPRKTYNKQKSEKWGFRHKKSGKQYTKVLQKIRQQDNCAFNDKNQGRKHIKHQTIVHATHESMPQNTVISTSTKSAPIITQFLVQNKIKHHRTKGKHQLKAFSNKSNARNRANFHAKAFKLRMQARSEPGQRCKHRENSESKFNKIFKNKNPTNQIRVIFPFGYVYTRKHCLECHRIS